MLRPSLALTVPVRPDVLCACSLVHKEDGILQASGSHLSGPHDFSCECGSQPWGGAGEQVPIGGCSPPQEKRLTGGHVELNTDAHWSHLASWAKTGAAAARSFIRSFIHSFVCLASAY